MNRILVLYTTRNEETNAKELCARMVALANDRDEVSKMFRFVTRNKERFGVHEEVTARDLQSFYDTGGADDVSELMKYGKVEFARTCELLKPMVK